MLFKIFYCDDSTTAKTVLAEYKKNGYDTGTYDRSDCATIDISLNTRNYADSRISIRNSKGREKYNDRLSYWRNYIVVFEDNTVISLFRDFNGNEDSRRNRDMLTTFIQDLSIKTKQSNDVFILEEDEAFVV